MKKALFVVTALGVLIIINSGVVNAQGMPEENKAKQEKTKAFDVGNKVCPVSGEKINDKMKAAYEYKGKIYNFCCGACIDEFKKDPKKYIKKAEEETQAHSGKEKQNTMQHDEPLHEQHSMH